MLRWLLPVLSLGLGQVLAAEPIFIQGEAFQCDGKSWQVRGQSSRYAPDSGLKHLWGADDGQGTATATVEVPEAGEYVIWVRHTVMKGATGKGPFRLTVRQGEKEVAAADFDVTAPATPPGEVHRYDWNSTRATLPAGAVTLELSKLPPLNCSGWTRQVDCLVLTTDAAYKPDVVHFQPKMWLRVTLGDTPCPPIYIHGFIDHFRGSPWYQHIALSKSGCDMGVAPKKGKSVFLNPGEGTAWCDITPVIHEDRGARLELRGAEKYSYEEWLPALDATFEFATAPEEGAIVRTIRRQGPGAGLSIVVPGVLTAETAHLVKADAEYCQENVKLAEGLPAATFGKRPEQFPFFLGFGLRAPLYSPDIRRAEFGVAAKLGFNGSHDMLDPLISSLGFKYARAGAGMWQMKDRCYSQPDLDKIKAGLARAMGEWQGPPPSFVSLMDEPHANDLGHVAGCEACKTGFAQWLRDDLKLTPAQLGVGDWGEVRPVTAEQKQSQPELFYYSQRFRAKVFADFLRLQTEMIAEQWPGKPVTTANFSDGTVYNGGMYEGGVDYFHIFGTNAMSMAWSEDWSNVSSSYQCAGYNVELLRCATNGRQPVGMYVITSYGRTPLDVKLKAYSSLGRGVRTLWSFAYGPQYSNHEPNWYLQKNMYAPVRDLAHEIGGAEDLLMQAKRLPSEVAFLYSTTSDIWTSFENSLYGHERMHSYLALTHAQVPVAFLSEEDVAAGKLKGYKALYVFGPNLHSSAAGPVAEWVKAGGVLYLSAGSAVADEFNRPARPLDEALGLKRGAVRVIEQKLWPGRYLRNLQPDGQVRLSTGEADVLAVAQPVEGSAEARFADGSAAACTVKAGKGTVHVAGFMPALSYVRKALQARDAAGSPAPDLEDPVEFNTLGSYSNVKPHEATYNPWEYPEAEREFLLAPVRTAGVAKPVTLDRRLVEAFYLEGERGAVVTLANYGIRPAEELSVTIRCSRPPKRVESVRQGVLKATGSGGVVQVKLPLVDTDMVKLYW